MVTRQRVLDYLQRCAGALIALGILNHGWRWRGSTPHGGEHGPFGDEETRKLEPAIAAARALGIDAVGPIAADSVFHLP